MRRHLFFCISVVLFALLGGCGSLSTQFKAASEPPETEARARLRVIANSLVKAIPGKNCIDWNAPGAGTVFGGIFGSSGFRGRSINMPSPAADKRGFGEMYVAADQPITLVFLTTPESRYHCSVAGSFVPQKNRDYEAELMLTPSECFFKLREIGEKVEPVAISKAVSCS